MKPNRYTRRGSLARLGGLAAATTIYPGWSSGRAVHIPVKVHVGGKVVHSGQLFFADSLTDTVYKAAPYSSRPNRDVRNAQDSIFVNGGKRGLFFDETATT